MNIKARQGAMESKPFSVFQIASAYIGTVVGAGFASGQEVLLFFATCGYEGLWGILVSTDCSSSSDIPYC
jgi:hypothetical protein